MGDDLVGRVGDVLRTTGLRANELAAQIGLDPSKFSKSMNGRRSFSSLELALIAEVGGTTVDWLLTGRPERRWQVAARATFPAPADAQESVRAIVSDVATRFDALRDLGLADPVSQLPEVPKSGRYVERAEKAARAAHQRLEGLPMAGTATASLIGEIEQYLGINVSVVQLPSGIDGLSYQDGDFRLIVLAATNRYARQRYTLAHELGHLLFGDAEEQVLAESLFSKRDISKQESRANATAASFLMPAEELRRELGSSSPEDKFDELVWRFWVSPDSLAWRLKNLDFIDDELRERLGVRTVRASADRIGKAGEFVQRSQQSENSRSPWRLVNKYLEAYSQGEVTLRPVAQLLRWSLEETEEFFADADIDSDGAAWY